MTTLRPIARGPPLHKTKGMTIFKGLAKCMAETWQREWPPDTQTSQSLVYELGFMRIDDPAPVLKKHLPGKRLVDLGAGSSVSYLAMAHFAASVGVSEYVAVDRYQDYSRAVSAMENFIRSAYPDIKLSAESEDMLFYLAQQPNCSANISINGVDNIMLRHRDISLERFYVQNLVAQIARVVPANGLVFGINSPLMGRLTEFGFEQVVSDLVTMDYELTKHNGIYQKKL